MNEQEMGEVPTRRCRALLSAIGAEGMLTCWALQGEPQHPQQVHGPGLAQMGGQALGAVSGMHRELAGSSYPHVQMLVWSQQ